MLRGGNPGFRRFSFYWRGFKADARPTPSDHAVPSSILAPSSDALVTTSKALVTRSDALVTRSDALVTSLEKSCNLHLSSVHIIQETRPSL